MATMPTDPTSPTYACEMAAYLSESYYSVIGGGVEKRIRYRGPNGEQEVEYSQTNLAALQNQMQYWQNKCDNVGSANPTPRRFAIRGGSRRGFWNGWGW